MQANQLIRLNLYPKWHASTVFSLLKWKEMIFFSCQGQYMLLNITYPEQMQLDSSAGFGAFQGRFKALFPLASVPSCESPLIAMGTEIVAKLLFPSSDG